MQQPELIRAGEIWICFILIWLVVGLSIGLTLYLPYAQPKLIAIIAGAGSGLVLAYFGAQSATVRRWLGWLIELVMFAVEVLHWVVRLFRIWH